MNPKLKLLQGGDVAFSRSAWQIIGTPYQIHVARSGGAGKSWYEKPNSEWSVKDDSGRVIWNNGRISAAVSRKHQVTIAKAFLNESANQS